MRLFNHAPVVIVLPCAWGFHGPVQAQAQPAPAAPAPAAAAAPAQDLLGNEQLEQLVSPIALYPDNLLAQMLMASTYPLEVVEASRWADREQEAEGRSAQKRRRRSRAGTTASSRWSRRRRCST